MSIKKANASEGILARIGMRIADWCEKWFPDAFVFAMFAVALVFIAGILLGENPSKMAVAFGSGFWNLVPFTMQMVLIIISGYCVASSPPVYRIICWLARIPKTPRGAVAFVAAFSMLTSLISWGFSLIFSGLLVREITNNIKKVDYRAIGAAAYLGLGSIWALGLSSSAALIMATKDALPEKLVEITGVIPLKETIFLRQSLLIALILILISIAIAYFSAPPPEKAKTAEDFNIEYKPLTVKIEPRQKPGEWIEYSPLLTIIIVLIGAVYVIHEFADKGGAAALNLNTYNFIFLMLGLLLHWRPRSFLKAVSSSVPATAGVLIQFPFYAGIFGIITSTAISGTLAKLFVEISTKHTYPLLVGIYSAILGLFVPSGGGKWVIEAPYIMGAAKSLNIHSGWVVQIYNAAEALPNLINPFWMLPLMGILNVRARELAGYSVLQMFIHVPVVLFLCWIFSYTL